MQIPRSGNCFRTKKKNGKYICVLYGTRSSVLMILLSFDRVKNKTHVLKEWLGKATEAITEVMCMMAKYSEGVAEECTEFVVQNCRSNKARKSSNERIAFLLDERN